jgi:predicted nucleic acid-binding protein
MLLDTSGLACCLDADDHRHGDAVELYQAAAVKLTHNCFIAEFVALSQARGLSRVPSLAFAAATTTDPEIEVVWVDPALHDEALAFLQSQLDKSYSLCDAVSFLLMRRHGIQDALSTDRHFEQAGYRRLLRP